MVTDGEYSDFHVEGVFSTRKKAENFTSNNSGTIEEILVDKLENVNIITTFYCYINLKSGEIHREGTGEVRIKNKTRKLVKRYMCNVGLANGDGVCVQSTYSVEHARKCAVEARQKYLRNGKRWENNFDINLEV